MQPFRSIDLFNAPEDAAGNVYRIAREVPDGSHGIDLQSFVDEGLIVSAPADHDPQS